MNENKAKKKFSLSDASWVYVMFGSIAMWLAMCAISGKFSFESLQTNIIAATFLAIVSIGQMLVVTTGKGAMDLSIPGTITLAAFLNSMLINGDPNKIVVGIIIIVLTGAAIGVFNSICVLGLKIPPMIATLAVNYILSSFAMMCNSHMGFERLVQADVLVAIASGKTFGIYNMIFVVAAITILVVFLLKKTTYGKSLIALGQNDLAAYIAGMHINKVQIFTYILGGVLGAIAGLLISVRSGGAFLGMGDDYLMDTVAGVVLGGTLMSGGRACAVGTVFGCLFIRIVVTLMQLAQFDIGVQYIIKGILIVAIIIIGTPSRRKTEQM
ncbi:MAG: ABC transporter permease [Clostridia bacterium]|jgi:ribose transport system permease protein|nr:ABC transporter permease [Clostridia bacterium]MCI2000718.1 ABC transporter permease [Clostridia bacterium]MCI2015209.1 ABC transporter permease [Clostridia bacterium]